MFLLVSSRQQDVCSFQRRWGRKAGPRLHTDAAPVVIVVHVCHLHCCFYESWRQHFPHRSATSSSNTDAYFFIKTHNMRNCCGSFQGFGQQNVATVTPVELSGASVHEGLACPSAERHDFQLQTNLKDYGPADEKVNPETFHWSSK